jgi:hypothetical protein
VRASPVEWTALAVNVEAYDFVEAVEAYAVQSEGLNLLVPIY